MGAYATRFVCRYVRFAHAHGFTPVARLSVIPLPMVAPLPPSISLRLRVRFSGRQHFVRRYVRRYVRFATFATLTPGNLRSRLANICLHPWLA